ncbi:MAG: hypothetical protein AAF481_12425 [Acidobacteriota bacterium]
MAWIAALAHIGGFGSEAQQQARIAFPPAANHLLVEYTVLHDELEENDPVPLLRIFGDGRALVHIPRYMRGAGDFQMNLDPGELDALVRSFEENGVLAFDGERLADQKRLADQARLAEEQAELHISDTSWTLLTIRLSLYDPAGNGLVESGLEREIVWPDVAWQAENYLQIRGLQGLAAAERGLRALLSDPRLTATEGAQ